MITYLHVFGSGIACVHGPRRVCQSRIEICRTRKSGTSFDKNLRVGVKSMMITLFHQGFVKIKKEGRHLFFSIYYQR